jgi:hypothetical protein
MFSRRTKITLTTTALAAALATFAGPSEGASGLPITTCGQTVTTSAILAHDLTCAGPGIIVGASGITIDLEGHAISGNPLSTGV